jgi:predicted transcriptional regulator
MKHSDMMHTYEVQGAALAQEMKAKIDEYMEKQFTSIGEDADLTDIAIPVIEALVGLLLEVICRWDKGTNKGETGERLVKRVAELLERRTNAN